MAQSPTAAGGGGSDRSTDGERAGGEGQHLLSVNLLPSRASPNVPVTSARTLGTHRGRILGSRLPMSAPRPNLVVENRQ